MIGEDFSFIDFFVNLLLIPFCLVRKIRGAFDMLVSEMLSFLEMESFDVYVVYT